MLNSQALTRLASRRWQEKQSGARLANSSLAHGVLLLAEARVFAARLLKRAWTLSAFPVARKRPCAGKRMLRLLPARMADRPDISGDGGDIGVGQRSTTARRHGNRIILRLRHAVGDRPRDPRQAAIALQPLAVDQRRRLRRTSRIQTAAGNAAAVQPARPLVRSENRRYRRTFR